ncbi:MAG: CDP-alcohol phosphatidyltransferase family protein [Clostridia bacterium]|nr:CDP-alcohol phosphatidyltransferase family protein [Clostridia bacterium]
MSKKIIGFYRSCDFVTMMSTISAIVGMIFAFNGQITAAVSCLILSGICDAFDGVLARRRENTKDETTYGEELDSLSDMMAFGVLPVIILLCDGLNEAWCYPFFVFYVLCGLIRLAYFNMLAQKKDTDKSMFIGIPITSITIVYPIFYIIFKIIFRTWFSNYVMMGMLFLTGILYVVRIKVKKPDSIMKTVLTILGVVVIVALGIWRFLR